MCEPFLYAMTSLRFKYHGIAPALLVQSAFEKAVNGHFSPLSQVLDGSGSYFLVFWSSSRQMMTGILITDESCETALDLKSLGTIVEWTDQEAIRFLA